jgi:hypothetical protein
LLDHAREPLPVKSGHREKVDTEYRWNGNCSLFRLTEPLVGLRHGKALSRRTKQDWAHQIQWLLDTGYPEAQKVVPVMDHLSTHGLSSRYEPFPPEEAFGLGLPKTLHCTPKQGSLLDGVQLQWSALAAPCRGDRRIGGIDTLKRALSAWHTQRNRKQKEVSGLAIHHSGCPYKT